MDGFQRGGISVDPFAQPYILRLAMLLSLAGVRLPEDNRGTPRIRHRYVRVLVKGIQRDTHAVGCPGSDLVIECFHRIVQGGQAVPDAVAPGQHAAERELAVRPRQLELHPQKAPLRLREVPFFHQLGGVVVVLEDAGHPVRAQPPDPLEEQGHRLRPEDYRAPRV